MCANIENQEKKAPWKKKITQWFPPQKSLLSITDFFSWFLFFLYVFTELHNRVCAQQKYVQYFCPAFIFILFYVIGIFFNWEIWIPFPKDISTA